MGRCFILWNSPLVFFPFFSILSITKLKIKNKFYWCFRLDNRLWSGVFPKWAYPQLCLRRVLISWMPQSSGFIKASLFHNRFKGQLVSMDQVWKHCTWSEGDPNRCKVSLHLRCKVPLYLEEWLPHDLFIHHCLMVYEYLMHELAYTLHWVKLIDSKIVRRSLATVVPGWLQHLCQIIN